MAPELAHPGGMITAAVWMDFDGDGRLDLVTAGEWMPIEFYHNEGTGFRNVTATRGLPPLRGWWYSLATADWNHDGHPDLVAGNLGLNYSYTSSQRSRFGVYAADFTGHRTTDIVLTQEINGTRSEEHTSELQSPCNLVCRLLLEKKKKIINIEEIIRLSMPEHQLIATRDRHT